MHNSTASTSAGKEEDSSETGSWNASADDEELAQETENIKGQIEETRSQMGETLDAIQEKLSFSNISEQVSEHVHNAVETGKEAVYDATIGKAAGFMKNVTNNISSSSIVRTAKDNPLPLMLIGLGAGLLAYKSYTSGSSSESWRRDQSSENRNSRFMTATSETESRSGSLGEMAGKASTSAGNAMEKVSGAFDNAYTGAGEMMSTAYEKVDEFKGVAVDRYKTYLNDNPLAVGAAALAVGAAVGMAIPASRYEGQLLGEKRDDFLKKAQTTAAGLLDKTKKAIADTDRPATPHKGSTADH